MHDTALSQLIYAIIYVVLYFPLGTIVEKYHSNNPFILVLYSPILPLLIGINLFSAIEFYYK